MVSRRYRRLFLEPLEARELLTVTGLLLTVDQCCYVAPGATIHFTAQADGGSGSYEYRFWRRSETGPWEDVQAYSTDSTWPWKTDSAKPGKYYVQVDARESGTQVEREFAKDVSQQIAPRTPASAVQLQTNQPFRVTPGTTIELSAQGQGGSDLYEYRFWLRSGQGVWQLARGYGTNSLWSWDTAQVPEDLYYVQVDVRTAGTSVERDATTTLSQAVTSVPPASGVVLQSDQPARIGPSTPVQFTAQGEGGNGRYEYRYWQRPADGVWSLVRDYAPDPTWTWYTDGAADGEHFTQVDVRSAGAVVERDATTDVTLVVSRAAAATGVVLTTNAVQPIRPGTTIAFEARGQGGEGTYEYRFRIRAETEAWRVVREYASDPAWQWNTAAATAAKYYVGVEVRTAGSQVSRDAVTDLSLAVLAPSSGVRLTSPPSGRVAPGSMLEFRAAGQGGTGAYEYRYWFRARAGVWTIVRDYSSQPTWQWYTDGVTSDVYYVGVEVRTAGSSSTRDGVTDVTLIVSPLAPATGIELSADRTGRIPPGSTVTFTAQGQGGTEAYEYRFWLRSRSGDSSIVREYSTDATWRWDTSAASVDIDYVGVEVRVLGSPADREAVCDLAVLVRKDETQLWSRLVRPYLADDLWTNRDAYDATNYLMLPLQAAFAGGPEAWPADFAAHFRRFVDSGGAATLTGDLNRTQYFYLASRFVSLAQSAGLGKLIPPGLVTLLLDEIQRLWQTEPISLNLAGIVREFSGGLRELVEWKLSPASQAYGQVRVIDDVELFVMAIAADLRAYERNSGTLLPGTEMIAEILETTTRVFQQEVVYQADGGWLFQPGIFAQHSDYLFAGYDHIGPHLCPAPVAGIALDSSHSHRMPVLLTSFADAYLEDSSQRRYFNDLKRGLEIQFIQHVLVPPGLEFSGYRTTNYMDGRNGVYRYEYATAGAGRGYGPYETSGTLTLGWWSFLGSERIREVYGDLAAQYPLPSDVIAIYVGPNTTRERHPLVRWPDALENGFCELLALLASHPLDRQVLPGSLSVSISAESIREAGGSTTATVTRAGGDISWPLVVTLTSSDRSEAEVPETVTIPANQASSAPFTITAVDDTQWDGTQTVVIAGRATGFVAGQATVDVTDWEETVHLYGTADSDLFSFRASDMHFITINGQEQAFDPAMVKAIYLHGSGGSDELSVVGGGSLVLVVLRPGTVDVTGLGYELHGDGFDTIRVYSTTGTPAEARLYDSAGDDTLLADGQANGARLLGTNVDLYAEGFAKTYAYATGGGVDTAKLYDSAGDDTLTADGKANGTRFQGIGFDLYAESFEKTYAYAQRGGTDRARMYDSCGDDLLQADGKANGARLQGPGIDLYAEGFAKTYAYATGGGLDTARLYDSAGDDTLTTDGAADGTRLQGPGIDLYAEGFERTYAYAMNGGVDTARMYDSAGDDTFAFDYPGGRFQGLGFDAYAENFDYYFACATRGGYDRSYLYDTGGNDVLVGRSNWYELTTPYASARGAGFDYVEATKHEGGTNTLDALSVDYLLEELDWV
ncbi:MAG: calcium-binding protein [Planctomycetota bacterium]|nr:calcium-binding protein [Planctomycetota bacterium]